MIGLASLPPWLTGGIFVFAAGTIWWAGGRLERHASTIATRTRLGSAFTGTLLLAGATSLPEIATTVAAVAVLNNPTLAVHNLTGGVALQTAILVVADLTQRDRGALTYSSPRFVLLIQAVALLFLLQITVAGIVADGIPAVFSVSVWSVLILATYIASTYMLYRYRRQPRWTPIGAEPPRDDDAGGEEPDEERESLRSGLAWFFGLAVFVLAGGWVAAESAEVLAEHTGLGDAFVGATLLALATSLPELSTTVSASRSGRYDVAISNVVGSNSFCIALLFLADALYRREAILAQAELTVVFVLALGGAMTCIYLWGLMEREDRTVGRIGWDSAAVLLLYAAGVTVLYFLE